MNTEEKSRSISLTVSDIPKESYVVVEKYMVELWALIKSGSLPPSPLKAELKYE